MFNNSKAQMNTKRSKHQWYMAFAGKGPSEEKQQQKSAPPVTNSTTASLTVLALHIFIQETDALMWGKTWNELTYALNKLMPPRVKWNPRKPCPLMIHCWHLQRFAIFHQLHPADSRVLLSFPSKLRHQYSCEQEDGMVVVTTASLKCIIRGILYEESVSV